jgi:hypothetical protein
VPRKTAHPQFGNLTRIRVILDEAEEIPSGVWEDVDNILITKFSIEHVKVIGASNPKDMNSRFGQRCEPLGGWGKVSIEDSCQWKGNLGWDVIRLDGAKCENVLQRKVVYEGLLTWEGYERYLKLGDTSPEYFTMARGWFPSKGLHSSVIPVDFVERSLGEYVYQGKWTYCIAIDLAFEGSDLAVATVGKWGRTSTWTPRGGTAINFTEPRYGLQVESQFEITKSDTDGMASQIIDTCKNLNIPPDWICCDRTGNGTGVHDQLRMRYGQNVMGLHFGEGASHTKVLDDDSQLADELYDGVVTELFFGMRKFMEFGFLKFGPVLRLDKLQRELTDRRFKNAGKERIRVESKGEYKARGNKSPDFADSLSMLVFLVRQRADFTAAMLATTNQVIAKPLETGYVDSLQFIDFDK